MSSNDKDNEKSDDLAKSIEGLKDEIKKVEEKQDQIIKTFGKRTKIILVTIAIAILLLYVSLTYFEPRHEAGYALTSNYVIEDLKGQKITTWVSWKINEGDLFHIHVVSSPEVTDERMNWINDVIFNNDTIQVHNQTYYVGWSGALYEAEKRGTVYPIPIHLHKMTTSNGSGNILIRMSNLSNTDGYIAFTKSITDSSNHQILKSEITIYEVDKLTKTEFSNILRHELGHAFGLVHSNDPNDLMYDEISRGDRYISQCDINALEQLYNGKEKLQVIC